MIELTYTDLFGLCVVLLLLGGTTAVYGLHFLAWTDRRRAARRFRALDLPEQRTPNVHVVITADTSGIDRELRRSQARADAIRDRHRPRRISDPPPAGMEDRVIERLHSLGEDLRAADPHSSSSNPTTEENPDGR